MVCEASTGYVVNLEIYTGKTNPDLQLGAVGTTVTRLLTNGNLHNKNHIVVMDRFYTSVTLFDKLLADYRTFAVGTTLTNRKFYPKVLAPRRPIHIVSNYHDPTYMGQVDRRQPDGTRYLFSISFLHL